MGLLQLSNHVVQKIATLESKWRTGTCKESHQIWIFFVQYVPVRHLLSSMAIFVPRDCSAAKDPFLY